MPAGKTHDRITWTLVLPLTLTSWWLTSSARLALVMAIAFLFSGLMFGPDLDIYSCQYQRWGWFRWLWLPYRSLVPHRSPLSHGFLIGTIGRLLYLALWLGLIAGVLLLGLSLWQQQWLIPQVWSQGQQWLNQWGREWWAGLIGLELGAMSHSVSDWSGSWLKRRSKGKKKKKTSRR